MLYVVVSTAANGIVKLIYLKEIVADHHEPFQLSNDPDARIGRKTADSSFFRCKTHLAMNEERIITVEVITTGEKNDGKQLQTLIDKKVVIQA